MSAEETGKEINGCGGVFSIPRRLTQIESRRHALFLARDDSKWAPGIDGEANARALLHPWIGQGSLWVLGYPKEPLRFGTAESNRALAMHHHALYSIAVLVAVHT